MSHLPVFPVTRARQSPERLSPRARSPAEEQDRHVVVSPPVPRPEASAAERVDTLASRKKSRWGTDAEPVRLICCRSSSIWAKSVHRHIRRQAAREAVFEVDAEVAGAVADERCAPDRSVVDEDGTASPRFLVRRNAEPTSVAAICIWAGRSRQRRRHRRHPRVFVLPADHAPKIDAPGLRSRLPEPKRLERDHHLSGPPALDPTDFTFQTVFQLERTGRRRSPASAAAERVGLEEHSVPVVIERRARQPLLSPPLKTFMLSWRISLATIRSGWLSSIRALKFTGFRRRKGSRPASSPSPAHLPWAPAVRSDRSGRVSR